MNPEELKAQAQDVLDRFPDAKYVIAFSDGNVFLDRDKNAAELHAASSKRTPQRFDREAQVENPEKQEAADDLKAGSTASDELDGKAAAPVEEPVKEPATEPATEPVVEPATEPATEPVVEPATEPAKEPAQTAPKSTKPKK